MNSTSRFFRGIIVRQKCLNLSKRWYNGNVSRQRGNLHGSHSDCVNVRSLSASQELFIVAALAFGYQLLVCSSTFIHFCYEDLMRYRRTVNAFYKTNGRVGKCPIDRSEETTAMSQAITDPSAMSVFYGKSESGKTFMVSNACHTTDEPIVHVDIMSEDFFLTQFADKIKYYQSEDETLGNYFKCINPFASSSSKQFWLKKELTWSDIVIHLNKCEEWLERVQKLPWYVLKFNIIT